MNIFETVLLCVSWVLISMFFYILVKEKKCAFVAALFTLPALYASLNMMTQIMTVDEIQYITNFLQMPDAQARLPKIIYQYRTTQILLGTMFTFFNQTIHTFSSVYKGAHWGISFLLSLAIVWVLNRYFFSKALKQNSKWHAVTITMTTIIIIALPVNVLLAKVCTYDSFGYLFALLALSLSIAGITQKSRKLAFTGFILSTFGAMEKIAYAPYYAVCAVLLLYVSLWETVEESRRVRVIQAVKTICIICVAPLVISFIVYFWQFALYRRLDLLFENTTPAAICFSFAYFVLSLYYGINSIWEMLELPIPSAYLLLCLVIYVVAIILYLLASRIRVQRVARMVLPKAAAVLFILISAIGIVSSYTNPTRIDPWASMAEDAYPSPYVLTSTGQIYHYGATTRAGAIFSHIAAHYAVIINALPTPLLLLLITYAIYSFFRKSDGVSAPIYWAILGCLVIPCVFALGGQPGAAPRYYVLVINLAVFLMLCDLLNQAYLHRDRLFVSHRSVGGVGLALCYCLLFTEIFLYSPNVQAFAPLWASIPKEYYHVPRTGYWYASEPMLWGEDAALVGKKIDKVTRAQEKDPQDIAIYLTYGSMWPYNPGYHLYWPKNLRETESPESFFNENTYFSLSRFALFRKEIPAFLTEVEPFDTISFRGMDTVWIYRGDQLADPEYIAYFLEE